MTITSAHSSQSVHVPHRVTITSFRLLGNFLMTLVLSFTLTMARSTLIATDECITETRTDCCSLLHVGGLETSSVSALSFLNCDWQTGSQLLPGFIITYCDSNGASRVLWGQFEECYTLELKSVDLDGSAPCEILTLFMDESGMWGHVHRRTYSDESEPRLQTLPVPMLRFSVDSDRTGILFTRVSPVGLKFEGIYGDSATCGVAFDSEADSLALIFTTKQVK